MALALYKQGDYRQAIQACDCAIDAFSEGVKQFDGIGSGSANNDNIGGNIGGGSSRSKAYVIRADARLAPKSCGALEEEMALSDLEMAWKMNPRSKEIRWVSSQFACVRIMMMTMFFVRVD